MLGCVVCVCVFVCWFVFVFVCVLCVCVCVFATVLLRACVHARVRVDGGRRAQVGDEEPCRDLDGPGIAALLAGRGIERVDPQAGLDEL